MTFPHQMAMVTCPEWISGKGNFIDCMHGGSIPDDVINRYCYIQVDNQLETKEHQMERPNIKIETQNSLRLEKPQRQTWQCIAMVYDIQATCEPVCKMYPTINLKYVSINHRQQIMTHRLALDSIRYSCDVFRERSSYHVM